MAWRGALASFQATTSVISTVSSSFSNCTCDCLRSGLRTAIGFKTARALRSPAYGAIGAMYRTGRAASLGRLSLHYASPATTRNTSSLRRPLSQNQQCLRAFNRKPSRLALTLHKPLSTSLQRYAGPYDKIDVKHEDKIEHERLPVQPEEVSTTSSVHQVFHEKGVDDPQDEEDMMAGIKSDMVGFGWLTERKRI